jgi:hypothetical protein
MRPPVQGVAGWEAEDGGARAWPPGGAGRPADWPSQGEDTIAPQGNPRSAGTLSAAAWRVKRNCAGPEGADRRAGQTGPLRELSHFEAILLELALMSRTGVLA